MSVAVASPVTEDPFRTPSPTRPSLVRELSDVWETLKPLGVTEEQLEDGPVLLHKTAGPSGDIGHIWKFLKGVKNGDVLLPPTPELEAPPPLRKKRPTRRGKRRRPRSASTTSPSSPAPSTPERSPSPGPESLRKYVYSDDGEDSKEAKDGKASLAFPQTRVSKGKKKRPSKHGGHKKRKPPASRASSEPDSRSPVSRFSSPSLTDDEAQSSPESPTSSGVASPTSSDSSLPLEGQKKKTARPNPRRRRNKSKSLASSSSSSTSPTPRRPALTPTPRPGQSTLDTASLSNALAKEAFLRAIRTSSNSIKQIKPDLSIAKKSIKCIPLEGGLRRKFVSTLLPTARHDLVQQKLEAKGLSTSRDKPIHVFIDNSNIIIGFYRALKRICSLSETAPAARPNFDFHLFSLILERGRKAKTKVLVGSLPKTPAVEQAEKQGYATDLLLRVEKLAPLPKPHPMDNAYKRSRSPPRRHSPPPTRHPKKRGEQAVDEILSLKMTLTLLDNSKPGVLVLASGDAAVGEFSDGFGRIVERFLAREWDVEVVCWKGSCGGRWKGVGRKGETEERGDGKRGGLRVVYLEEFVEGLLGDGEEGD
ncbi:hypothetical protein BJ508DRAFT_331481 [Ascobolus immersus RN42]|uniref:NYN domain-containing protein n=1 Tax=Ascobolus immersus RN42 TaxID=1160509 RepID=A0A3N4HS06_ASCIM|nr:hypothetical protein BJ508DRAFT_331481 [Ascobolus immersus RN42]